MGRQRGVSKEKVGFSIDLEVASDLNEYCELNSINRSSLINKLIKIYLERSKKGVESYVEANDMDH